MSASLAGRRVRWAATFLVIACSRSPKPEKAALQAAPSAATAAPTASAASAERAGAPSATEPEAGSAALPQDVDGCETAMSAVAFAQPAIKRALAAATNDAPFGGVSYPIEDGRVSSAIGYQHPDHFEAAFFLTWEKGVFTINDGDVHVSVAEQARVKAACAPERR